MTVKLSTALRNAMVSNGGFSSLFTNGVIEIRTGPQPLSADSPPTGVLLGIITENGGAWAEGAPTNGLNFAAPDGGVVTKTVTPWRMTGLAAGQAGWFRLRANASDPGGTSTTHARLDGTVGVGAGDMELSSVAIAVGVPVTLDTFQFRMPAQ